jgi:hypothetical protein
MATVLMLGGGRLYAGMNTIFRILLKAARQNHLVLDSPGETPAPLSLRAGEYREGRKKNAQRRQKFSRQKKERKKKKKKPRKQKESACKDSSVNKSINIQKVAHSADDQITLSR